MTKFKGTKITNQSSILILSLNHQILTFCTYFALSLIIYLDDIDTMAIYS